MKPIISFIRRLLKEQPLRIVLIVCSLGLAGLLEGFGLAALIPLIEMIGSDKGVSSSGKLGKILQNILAVFNLPLNLATVLSFIFVIIVAQQIVILIQKKLSLGSIYRFEAMLRGKLYQDIFSAGWPFFLQEKTGDLTNVLTTETKRAGDAYEYLNTLLGLIMLLVVYLGVAFFLSWQMTLIVILIGFAITFLLKKRVSVGSKYGKTITRLNSDLQCEAIEHISGAKLIKGCAIEKNAIGRFSKYLNRLAHEQYKNYINQAWLGVLYDFASVSFILLAIYFSIEHFNMPMAKLIVFLFIFYRISPRISGIQRLLYGLLSLLPALDRVNELSAKALSFKEESGNKIIDGFTKNIVFNNVSFSYQDDDYVLKDLNLEIHKGKTVAIVGSSGVGKTTIVDLLMGLIRPTKGDMLVDDVSLKELDVFNWRNKIGYVAQDSVFFHATVKENITWIYPQASDEDVEKAAKFAYAHEFIEKLPQGYDTIIGDRGVRLSGGQKQRLALARAIIRKPEILILDEATSALDAESEAKIQKAVELLAGLMTVVIVTHRLATVKNADLIYVLDNGELVEKGTWRELVEKKGKFYKLKSLQTLE